MPNGSVLESVYDTADRLVGENVMEKIHLHSNVIKMDKLRK